MSKDSYRIIFEGTFDNALYDAIQFLSCATLVNERSLLCSAYHVSLYRMLNMAYEMDVVTWEEERYLKTAIQEIFRGVGA